jgi:bloom syndrome protein
MILAHFNERFDPHLCPTGCDNCSKGGTIVRELYTSEAQQAIRLFKQMTASMDRIPVGHFKDVFAGRNKAKVRDSGHDQLSLYGIGKGVDGDRIISVMMDTEIFAIAREASTSGWTNDYLKVIKVLSLLLRDLTLPFNLELGSQADACLSGDLAVELIFRDNGAGSGSSRSVAKNVAFSEAPAGTKGKMKAGPGPSSYMPLYEDDGEPDTVSDFEPMKDAADTDATAQPQDSSQTRLKAMVAVRQRVKVFLWSSSYWLI